MKSANKTKKQMIDEMQAMWERVFEPEKHESNSRQVLGNFGRRMDHHFPHMTQMNEAIFVVFDKKVGIR